MTTSPNSPSASSLADEFAAALDWWKEAGVDSDFTEDATDWLEEATAQTGFVPDIPVKPKSRPATPPPSPSKKIGGDTKGWPSELGAFKKWWLDSGEIDDGGAFPVVAPRGASGPELLILVSEPEETDSDRLLSGKQGQLLEGILRAIGLSDERVFVASALRRHTPMPDWPTLQAAGLGNLLTHYIGLVNPKRILAFGRNIPPLLGNDTAQGAANLHNINHEGRSIPVLGVGSLAELMRSAPRRQRFWQHWLEWTGS